VAYSSLRDSSQVFETALAEEILVTKLFGFLNGTVRLTG
jgi:hypothetical protein